jgi:hypothetical protein
MTGIQNAYTKMAGTLIMTRIAVVLGFVSLWHRRFVKKYHYLPLVIFASTLSGFMATCISGRYWGHEYMQLVPSYVLFGVCGLAFGAELLSRFRLQRAVVVLLLLVGLILADWVNLKEFGSRLSLSTLRWEGDWLTQYVLEHTKPNDKIWAPSFPANHLYVDTGRLSPTKWFVLVEGWPRTTAYGTKEEKVSLLRQQLRDDPPHLIALNNRCMYVLEKNGFGDWIRSNYQNIVASEKSDPRGLQVWVYMN